ncbi:MAG: VacJ family lipoprotein [Proteobacteria bacterium]|nr:VacJ family lipoprotein [Pseudomonadota bacterium]
MIYNDRRRRRVTILITVMLSITACATNNESAGEPVRAESDPWETMNRGIYGFSSAVDRATLKPIARGYRWAVPQFARRGVTNFSDNLFTPRSALNNFLQGKGKAGFSDIGRFVINSTIGIGGLFDVASAAGLEEYGEDFSQTLAVWGLTEGPYIYVPFLGPHTLLDVVALPVDFLSDPWAYYNDSSVRDRVYVLRTIDVRARLLPAEKLIEDSQDPYITLRESYLQNRLYEVHDGDPPEDDDFYDEFLDEE